MGPCFYLVNKERKAVLALDKQTWWAVYLARLSPYTLGEVLRKLSELKPEETHAPAIDRLVYWLQRHGSGVVLAEEDWWTLCDNLGVGEHDDVPPGWEAQEIILPHGPDWVMAPEGPADLELLASVGEEMFCRCWCGEFWSMADGDTCPRDGRKALGPPFTRRQVAPGIVDEKPVGSDGTIRMIDLGKLKPGVHDLKTGVHDTMFVGDIDSPEFIEWCRKNGVG